MSIILRETAADTTADDETTLLESCCGVEVVDEPPDDGDEWAVPICDVLGDVKLLETPPFVVELVELVAFELIKLTPKHMPMLVVVIFVLSEFSTIFARNFIKYLRKFAKIIYLSLI